MGSRIVDYNRRIMVKLLFLTILGCLLACNVSAETKKSENENRQMSLADMMNEFKNSYSANRGKRDISEEEEFEDDEITEDELDELMGRYFNPNGFLSTRKTIKSQQYDFHA